MERAGKPLAIVIEIKHAEVVLLGVGLVFIIYPYLTARVALPMFRANWRGRVARFSSEIVQVIGIP